MTGGPVIRRRRTDTATSDEDSSNTSNMPTPPDGGWGWVVVFASFMIHVIADGVTYTFGIFFVEFLSFYGEGKGITSAIASILVGITLGAGPLASALTNKYGCRAVTIAGSILAAFGFFTGVFAENVTQLCITIGVCGGLGFGLIYLPAIVSVTCYFEKRRAFATGIAVCGSGLGTFIFAPLIEQLVETYAMRGALLLVSGMILNCVVFGALFRPLKGPSSSTVKHDVEILATTAEKEILMNGVPPKLKAELVMEPLQPVDLVSNGHTVVTTDGMRMSMSAHNLTTQRPQPHKGSHKSLVLGSHQSLMNRPGEEDANVPTGVMYRKDIFYSGSLLNIPQYRSNPQMYTMSINHIPKGYQTRNSYLACFDCSKETRDTLVEMMDLSVLKDPIFVLFAISNFCTSIGFNVPYVYTTDRALLQGISKENSSFLLSIIGIANTISRVVLGYISDKPWLNRLWLYNSALTLCGLSTMFSAFAVDYTSMVIYCAIYGVTAGAYVGLTSVILVDLLGLEKLTNAFGVVLLFQGVASLIGPPIAGWLFDWLDSYDPGFYVAGAMIAISGAMLFLIPVIRYWQKKRAAGKRQPQLDDTSYPRTIPHVTVVSTDSETKGAEIAV